MAFTQKQKEKFKSEKKEIAEREKNTEIINSRPS